MSADKQLLTSENMKWLGVEVRRSLRKEKARQAAFQEQRLQERRVKYNPSKTLLEFKQMLKKKFGGSLVRAWRAAFCTRNTMSMQKPQFLKACAELGWRKDVRAMWYLLDKDANGCVTVEEFDYENAQALARFHKYILQHFRSVETAFKVLDVDRNLYVPKEEFEAAAGRMGFEPAVAEQIYAALDLKAMGKIFEEDMRFLDTWKPRAFLTAEANHAAADQVKSRLLKKYGSFLRAWRLCLDKSSNNMCSWEEFRDACKEVGCQEDAPGAWVALESRRAGSLTLQDVDPTAGEALAEFRDWAVEQFGSVKTCFTVLDDDGSNEVTPFEFKQACRAYGFKGAAKLAFKALDTNGRGILSTDDISFLDEWTGSESGLEEPMDAGLAEDALDASRAPSKSSRPQALPDMVKLVDELDWQEGRADSLNPAPHEGSVPPGALHPAFRMWANRKRKKPVRRVPMVS
ncbi:unnamed protein product [Effrenium voratum]|nr:unnamed protein product [Effrenium voratum]